MAIVQGGRHRDRHRYHPVRDRYRSRTGTGTGTGTGSVPLLACWVFGATRRCNVRLVRLAESSARAGTEARTARRPSMRAVRRVSWPCRVRRRSVREDVYT